MQKKKSNLKQNMVFSKTVTFTVNDYRTIIGQLSEDPV